MRLVSPGIDVATGELLVASLSPEQFAGALSERLLTTWPQAQSLASAAVTGVRLRGVMERSPTPDLGDPRVAGWTYLVAADDPQRDEIARVIEPLARHRGMAEPHVPLVFCPSPPEEWAEWMTLNYGGFPGASPQYVLIVGGPERVPFHFQAVLGIAASVGRLAFDDIALLEGYVDKVLRLEGPMPAVTTPEVLMFATDGGRPDPTYYSRRYMAEPIAQHVREALKLPVRGLYGELATSSALLEGLTTGRSAVVYIATHGAARPGADVAVQRQINGAVVCTPVPGAIQQALLSAADIPLDGPVAEGAIVLQFSCFGGGSPAESDYSHWLGQDLPVGGADFVAALPNALLGHPRGPLAFIGHVDLAWLHAFDDPDDPDIEPSWHPRLAPFVYAVQTLLGPQPVGLAMRALSKRFEVGNQTLAVTFDRLGRGRLPDGPEDWRKLVRAFITRSDAQNYLVLGDPAVYPRMSTD